MSVHLQRAWMLLGQSRFDMAEEELRQALAEDPDDASAHGILAVCMVQRDAYAEAEQEAQTAIHLAPDQPFSFYAHAVVMTDTRRYADAMESVLTAIGLDPYEPRYHALHSQIHYAESRWSEALQAADQGLAQDPEDVACTNLRAQSLIKLGRKTEASDALSQALGRAPDDADTHASMGWTQLEQGNPEQAMHHFQEALRLEPDSKWARAGIVEAMKSRYFIYRWMLGFFMWMVKLQERSQWTILIGAFVGYQVLLRVARNNAALAPFIMPMLIAYVSFCIMTWIASPLFNLVLRTSRFGRLALGDEEIRTSTWVGVCMAGSIAMVIAYFIVGSTEMLISAVACAMIIPAVAHIYDCDPDWPRAVLSLIAIALVGMAAIIVTGFFCGHFMGGRFGDVLYGIAILLYFPHLIASVATQFLTNYLVSVRPRRDVEYGGVVWIVGLSTLGTLALLLIGLIALLVVSGPS